MVDTSQNIGDRLTVSEEITIKEENCGESPIQCDQFSEEKTEEWTEPSSYIKGMRPLGTFNGIAEPCDQITLKEKIYYDSEEEFQCVEKPTSKKYVEDSMRRVRYQCRYCGTICATQALLKNHLKRHVLFKPFRCKFCRNYFPTKQDLKEHMKRHSLKCADCDSTFTSTQYLNAHIRTQHMKVTMRFYRCENCDETFERIREVKTHCQNGSGKCNFTNETFTLHSRTNTDIMLIKRDPMYVCTLCRALYTTAFVLKDHMTKHNVY